MAAALGNLKSELKFESPDEDNDVHFDDDQEMEEGEISDDDEDYQPEPGTPRDTL